LAALNGEWQQGNKKEEEKEGGGSMRGGAVKEGVHKKVSDGGRRLLKRTWLE